LEERLLFTGVDEGILGGLDASFGGSDRVRLRCRWLRDQ
jgi:hypothetical protein